MTDDSVPDRPSSGRHRLTVPAARRGHGGSRADILLVGLAHSDAEAIPQRLFGALADSTVGVPFSDLARPQIEMAMAVLSPVVAEDFDAVDLAQRLQRSGFRGRYIAYGDGIPDAGIVRGEVADAAPGLAFEIIAMGGPRLASCDPSR